MTSPPDILSPGTTAPDFTLEATTGDSLTLSDFRGQPVVLVFYPSDWSPTCSDQLALYQELLPEFQRHNAVMLAISVDGIWSHRAFATDRNIEFPILADFEPKGAVARMYGTYNHEPGKALRSLFVIDEDGVITWSHLPPAGVNPGADGILKALEALETPGALALA
jgi:peroxiredoxin